MSQTSPLPNPLPREREFENLKLPRKRGFPLGSLRVFPVFRFGEEHASGESVFPG